ncbi:UNVERIFIED_CONTAM: hypothetical protein FKN15_010751 [Acipenser sinensis]
MRSICTQYLSRHFADLASITYVWVKNNLASRAGELLPVVQSSRNSQNRQAKSHDSHLPHTCHISHNYFFKNAEEYDSNSASTTTVDPNTNEATDTQTR